MAAQGTQDHRISIIQGGSSSRTHPVQPVSLSGMTRTLRGFGQCVIRTKYNSARCALELKATHESCRKWGSAKVWFGLPETHGVLDSRGKNGHGLGATFHLPGRERRTPSDGAPKHQGSFV